MFEQRNIRRINTCPRPDNSSIWLPISPSAQAHYVASIRKTISANSDNSLLTVVILISFFEVKSTKTFRPLEWSWVVLSDFIDQRNNEVRTLFRQSLFCPVVCCNYSTVNGLINIALNVIRKGSGGNWWWERDIDWLWKNSERKWKLKSLAFASNHCFHALLIDRYIVERAKENQSIIYS